MNIMTKIGNFLIYSARSPENNPNINININTVLPSSEMKMREYFSENFAEQVVIYITVPRNVK